MSTDISINQEQPNFLVYKHTNKINGKVYIGITSLKPEQRWGNNGYRYKPNIHFYSAIQKYGWDNFEHEIIQENLSELDAELLEEKLIDEYDATNPEKGYNISCSSVGGYMHHTEQTKQKIKKALTGKPKTEEHKNNMRKPKGNHLIQNKGKTMKERLNNPNWITPLKGIKRDYQRGENNPAKRPESRIKLSQNNAMKKDSYKLKHKKVMEDQSIRYWYYKNHGLWNGKYNDFRHEESIRGENFLNICEIDLYKK